jgi:hypothetical protein
MYIPKRTFPEVKPAERKIDDRQILLFHEYVLGELFKVENNIWRELLTLVSSQSARIFLKCVGNA